MSIIENDENCVYGKKHLLCKCVDCSIVSESIVSLEFSWSGPAPKGGQFFLTKPERTSVFLGRPLSVAGWYPESIAETFNNTLNGNSGILCFLLAVRGRGTKELAELKPGEKAWLSGPLGRGFTDVSESKLSEEALNHRLTNRNIALVSGGVGLAPLLCFAKELESKTYDFYAGFRSKSFGLKSIQPRALIITSEDGSEGRHGRVLDYFSPGSYSAVFACGPEQMLKSVAEISKAAGVPCFLSLERRMACGTGACLGCTVKTSNGNKRCCADGPVFNAEDIYFDE